MYCVKKLFEKSPRYYQDNMSGSLTKRIFDLAEAPIELIDLLLCRGLVKFFMILSIIIILFSIKLEFGLLISTWTFISAISLAAISPRVVNASKKYSEQSSLISGQLTDAFTNILSIRLFANWDCEKDILQQSTLGAMEKERRLGILFLIINIILSYSFIALQIISFYLLIKYKSLDKITAGDFALVLTLNYNVVTAIWELRNDINNFTKALGKTQQALKDIFAEVEVGDIKDAKNLTVNKGEIEFKNVNFKYSETIKNTFENFSCILKPGQKVGLVGESGAGKTTFVNLLLRMYDIQQGEIRIDSQNIAHVTQDSLYKNIGVIPQDPSLFHRTLFENIQYGDLLKSDDEVYEAARNASAYDFILSTPKRYKSLVGERGVKISGGQRQRIAIARAFLKAAPILILDEATSALDSVTEREIQATLWKLMKGKTCIVIAHRLSTLVDMDRILVLDQGKIVQDGTHAELSAQIGIYKHLWDTQSNGFI
jgi:ATP-binding cassette subfamily B protein